jgi:hypothetical protein
VIKIPKRLNIFTVISNTKGAALLVMMTALTSGILYMCYYFYNSFSLRKVEDQKLVHVSNLTAYTQSTKSLLISQKAFMNSAQLPVNGAFYQCLNNPEYDCNVAVEQNFTLLSEDGTIFNDPSSAGNGITSTLLPCTSFPSVDCPFRYELKWSRECIGSGPCRTPDLFIRGQLVVGNLAGIKFNLNPVNYTLQVKIR